MINEPHVVAAIATVFAQYEAALVSNDVAKLIDFFWDSDQALRFGVNESLYGSAAIARFRKERPPIDLARHVFNEHIVTFGDDTAIVTIEFKRSTQGAERHGRQSQVWRKFDAGWKIVSAHVSLIPLSYMDLASQIVGLPIPSEFREGVRTNLERSAAIGKALFDFPLDDSIENAPVFVP